MWVCGGKGQGCVCVVGNPGDLGWGGVVAGGDRSNWAGEGITSGGVCAKAVR